MIRSSCINDFCSFRFTYDVGSFQTNWLVYLAQHWTRNIIVYSSAGESKIGHHAFKSGSILYVYLYVKKSRIL